MNTNFRPFSRYSGCRTSDAFTYCNFRQVFLENDWMRVCVLPEKGAEIFQLEYKPHNMDVLFKRDELRYFSPYPAAVVNSPTGFVDSYTGGWQELFPSGGSACQVGGAKIGTHGEVIFLPWNWEILEDHAEKVSVKFSVRLLRFPFKLTRVMSIEKQSAVLTLEENIVNEGVEPLPYMWGHHPAFGAPFLDSSCLLDLPDGSLLVHEGEPDPKHRLLPGSRGFWPEMQGAKGEKVDLRKIPSAQSRKYDMFYLAEFKEGWYALSNPNQGFGVAMQWDADVFSSLWIWQEFCGSASYPWYSDTYALGLEPFTSFTTKDGSGLEEIMRIKSEKWLAPGESIQTKIKAIFYDFPGGSGVKSIGSDGVVSISE